MIRPHECPHRPSKLTPRGGGRRFESCRAHHLFQCCSRNKATCACPRPPEIARIVDQVDLEDRLILSSIRVDFLMNGSDGEFLASYVQWRMANLIVK